jgi:hypothetical protein
VATYPRMKNGEWVKPKKRSYKMACCDCGLVHRMDFIVSGRKVIFRMFRDNRATAAMRRRKKKL